MGDEVRVRCCEWWGWVGRSGPVGWVGLMGRVDNATAVYTALRVVE